MQYILVICFYDKKSDYSNFKFSCSSLFNFLWKYFEFELNEFQMSIFKDSVIIYLILTGSCFFVGEVSRNYSQVDKVWSIAPIIYVWFFTYHSDYNLRMILMSI